MHRLRPCLELSTAWRLARLGFRHMHKVPAPPARDIEERKVAVVLTGCGHKDGSEVHEASSILSHCTRNYLIPQCFALDTYQKVVIDHQTGEPQPCTPRHVMDESARIARKPVLPVCDLVTNVCSFQAVLFCGGFGVATTMTDFAKKGKKMSIRREVCELVDQCRHYHVFMCFVCIAPIIAARLIHGVSVTLGGNQPPCKWPYSGAIEIAQTWGADVQLRKVNEICVDRKNLVLSTPAYMYRGKFHEVDDGIGSMVRTLRALIRCRLTNEEAMCTKKNNENKEAKQ